MGVLPGVIGSLQAMETLKLVLGVGDSLAGRLLIFDALDMSWREVALRRNPDCPVCGDHPSQTGLIDYEVFCGVAPATDGDPAADHVPELDPSDVVQRMGTEREVGNLEVLGARLIPLGELENRVGEIPRDHPIVVVCRSGQRSHSAARRLLDGGYAEVFNLRGGMQAWARDVDSGVAVA
jgi:adenylyltransferase/sulfurtransferase